MEIVTANKAKVIKIFFILFIFLVSIIFFTL